MHPQSNGGVHEENLHCSRLVYAEATAGVEKYESASVNRYTVGLAALAGQL